MGVGELLPSSQLSPAEQRRHLVKLMHAASLRLGKPVSEVTIKDLLAPIEVTS